MCHELITKCARDRDLVWPEIRLCESPRHKRQKFKDVSQRNLKGLLALDALAFPGPLMAGAGDTAWGEQQRHSSHAGFVNALWNELSLSLFLSFVCIFLIFSVFFYVRIAIYISSSIILQFSFHYTPILINITLSQIFLSGAYLQHHQQKYSYLMYQLSVQVSLNTKSFALSLTTPTANFSFYAKMVFCWRLQTAACHHDFSFFLFIPFTPFSYSQVWRTPSGPYLRLWMKRYIFL